MNVLKRGFVKKGLGIRFGTDDAFRATALETALGEIVAKYCGRANARMIEKQSAENECKV